MRRRRCAPPGRGADPPGDPRIRSHLPLWRRGDGGALRRSRPPSGRCSPPSASAAASRRRSPARRPRSRPPSASPARRSTASTSAACSRPADRRLYEAKAAGGDRVLGRPTRRPAPTSPPSPAASRARPADADEAAPHLPRIVIIGAGFGGLACAKALGGADAASPSSTARNYHLFVPLLYQVADRGAVARRHRPADPEHAVALQEHRRGARRGRRARHGARGWWSSPTAPRCPSTASSSLPAPTTILRPRRLGRGGAGADDDRGRAHHPGPAPPCLRARRDRHRPGRAGAAPHHDHRRRRPDRRRDGGLGDRARPPCARAAISAASTRPRPASSSSKAARGSSRPFRNRCSSYARTALEQLGVTVLTGATVEAIARARA